MTTRASMINGQVVTGFSPSDRTAGDPPPPGDACPATLDGSSARRCCRRRGHDGLHRWQAPDGAEHFEWG
ncbi:MAG TPA: hypothetical protein VGD80_38070 [Kofleriaceae bacterium]